jgi:hypothetical protein
MVTRSWEIPRAPARHAPAWKLGPDADRSAYKVQNPLLALANQFLAIGFS